MSSFDINLPLLVVALVIWVLVVLITIPIAAGYRSKSPNYTAYGINFINLPKGSDTEQIQWIQEEYKKINNSKCSIKMATQLLLGWKQSKSYKIFHHGENKSV